MRRRANYKKRGYKPDYLYQRVDVSRFIHYLMKKGKRSVAEKIFHKALNEVALATKEDSLNVFERSITHASPLFEVVSRRVGGANYQIPIEVRPERKFFLAAHWIIAAARNKKGKPMYKKLAEEIIAASKNEGVAIKKKQDTHRIAEANRAFASFAR